MYTKSSAVPVVDFSSENGFKQLYRGNYPTLHRVAYNITGSAEAAEDVVHQVFLKVWEKRVDLKISGDMSHYLKRSVINTALNYLKQHRKIIQLEPEHQLLYEPSGEFDRPQIRQAVKDQLTKTVESLPSRCQLVFALSRYEGMSNQEIADHLGISKKTVENQLNKALSRLRQTLKPYLEYLTNTVVLISGQIFLKIFMGADLY